MISLELGALALHFPIKPALVSKTFAVCTAVAQSHDIKKLRKI